MLLEDPDPPPFICIEEPENGLYPKLLGPHGEPPTWRLHNYKGIGRLPPNLRPVTNPALRTLLNKLPGILRAHAKTSSVDAVVVVLDTDSQPCADLLRELKNVAFQCGAAGKTMFRLAIEETEAWYLGDRNAALQAYPRAKKTLLNRYKQDSISGTWERLADIVYPGGAAALQAPGGPTPGDAKHEWAEQMGPRMDPGRNLSPSFGKLRDGIRLLAKTSLALAAPTKYP